MNSEATYYEFKYSAKSIIEEFIDYTAKCSDDKIEYTANCNDKEEIDFMSKKVDMNNIDQLPEEQANVIVLIKDDLTGDVHLFPLYSTEPTGDVFHNGNQQNVQTKSSRGQKLAKARKSPQDRKKQKAYREKNKERIRQAILEWHQRNPEKRKEYGLKAHLTKKQKREEAMKKLMEDNPNLLKRNKTQKIKHDPPSKEIVQFISKFHYFLYTELQTKTKDDQDSSEVKQNPSLDTIIDPKIEEPQPSLIIKPDALHNDIKLEAPHTDVKLEEFEDPPLQFFEDTTNMTDWELLRHYHSHSLNFSQELINTKIEYIEQVKEEDENPNPDNSPEDSEPSYLVKRSHIKF